MAGLRRFGSEGIPLTESEGITSSPLNSSGFSTLTSHSKSTCFCSPSLGSTSSLTVQFASCSIGSPSSSLVKLVFIIIYSPFFKGSETTPKKKKIIILISFLIVNLETCLKAISNFFSVSFLFKSVVSSESEIRSFTPDSSVGASFILSLVGLSTKFELVGLSSKFELVGLSSKFELVGLSSKFELVGLSTKFELVGLSSKSELDSLHLTNEIKLKANNIININGIMRFLSFIFIYNKIIFLFI